MIKVFEAFSGIGSQAKALENIGIEYEILATADWDITAIIAYDLIHNGKQDLSKYNKMTKKELVKWITDRGLTISANGKEAYPINSISHFDVKTLKRLICAIERSKNKISITDIKGRDLPNDIDLFTYSFPCQDLSIAGVWHGNMTGIDRDANNRSGMLWEVERIIKEMVDEQKKLPRFLLMENVKNIQAPRHRENFNEWKQFLTDRGYYNIEYCLNSKNFGSPQTRERVYMISVQVNDYQNANEVERVVKDYFDKNNLQNNDIAEKFTRIKRSVSDLLRIEYHDEKYKNEADKSQIKDTPSRVKIVNENSKIYTLEGYVDLVKTITTKQDRNPNSGVIEYYNEREGYLNYRYLTPRECFLFMGFDEEDYNILIENNYMVSKTREFFSDSKLIKLAGNSIVVNVLESIFMQINEVNSIIHDL